MQAKLPKERAGVAEPQSWNQALQTVKIFFFQGSNCAGASFFDALASKAAVHIRAASPRGHTKHRANGRLARGALRGLSIFDARNAVVWGQEGW